MTTNLLPISSDGGFTTAGNITTASYASPAPTISGFSTVSADNLRLMNGNITGGVATVVDDGINSIALALGAQMDVFGFPFSGGGIRGQLTISDVLTPNEVNGTWYYQSINTNTYKIYTDSTYSTLVDATGWSAYTGGGNVAIVKQVPAANILINSNGYLTEFDNTGNLVLPAQGSITSPGGNLTIKASGETGDNPAVANSVIIRGGNTGTGDGGHIVLVSGVAPGAGGHAGNINITASNGQSLDGAINLTTAGGDWVFDGNGNLTTPGSIIFGNSSYAYVTYGANNYINLNNDGGIDLSCNTEVKITTNYGDAPNRAYSYFYANGTFAAAGNITTTGNITATNIGNVAALNLDGSSSNVLYGNGVFAAATGGGSNIANGNSNVSIATANGNVTIAAVGNTTMTITGTGANITGTANITGNLVAGNIIGTFANGNSNVAIATANGNVVTNVTGQTILTVYSGGIKVGGSGIIQSPGGAQAIVLNNNGANLPIANITNTLNVTGAAGANITANLTVGNISTAGNITGNTNGFAIGYLNIPQVGASNTTLALTDAGKHYYSTTAGNLTLTVPLNSSVAFPTGTAISIVVQAAGNILVNAASGVTLYMAGNSTSANRVVGTYGMATLMKVASDTWFINGTGVS